MGPSSRPIRLMFTVVRSHSPKAHSEPGTTLFFPLFQLLVQTSENKRTTYWIHCKVVSNKKPIQPQKCPMHLIINTNTISTKTKKPELLCPRKTKA